MKNAFKFVLAKSFSKKYRLVPVFFFGALFSVFVPRSVSAAPEVVTAGAELMSSKIFDSKMHWEDDRGQQGVLLSQWRDRPIVFSMIYTECKLTCPNITLKKLNEIQKRMDQEGRAVEFVLVTLDPDSDTPEVRTRFRKTKGLERSNWHFLRGSQEATRNFADLLGLGKYWKMEDHIVHGFAVLYLDARAGLMRTLDFDHREVDRLFINQPHN